jgi:hypothetical protein
VVNDTGLKVEWKLQRGLPWVLSLYPLLLLKFQLNVVKTSFVDLVFIIYTMEAKGVKWNDNQSLENIINGLHLKCLQRLYVIIWGCIYKKIKTAHSLTIISLTTNMPSNLTSFLLAKSTLSFGSVVEPRVVLWVMYYFYIFNNRPKFLLKIFLKTWELFLWNCHYVRHTLLTGSVK